MTDHTHSTSRTGPLAGVRILDLTSVIMGPFATQILAQLGAEVIKVETPDGDNMRHVGPMCHPGMGHIFLHANAGKRSIALDLKHPEGREAALRLAERCDVLISNVRPQALARLGLDHAAVSARNPRIIHVSCCGFDQEGPDAARPAYDDLIQGATGIPWLMQRYGAPEPAYAPTTLSDRVTGLHAVYAVTAALYALEKTGQGQAIVVPMFEAMAQFILGDHMAGLTFDPPRGDPGYARLLTAHRKPYATADGMLCVLIYNDKHWRSFFAAIGEIGEAQGLAQDPRFATHSARAAHIDAVYAEVARILRTRTTADWQALLDAADVPNMPMNSPADLLTDAQLRATGFLHDSVHPTEGPMHAMAHPTRWSATPPARTQAPAPQLGEHTRALLSEAGYSPAHIETLLSQGACRAATTGVSNPCTPPRYLVRAAQVPSYQPANHHHTFNQRLIGPETVGAEQMEVLLGTLHKGGGALPHAHPGIEQSCYLLEGTARAEVAGEAFDMVPGDMCFFPADQMHVFTVTSDTPVKLLVIYSPPYGESPDKVIRPAA